MRIPDVDLLAGLGGLVAAGIVFVVPGLELVVAPAHTIGAFSVAALGRWYNRARRRQGLPAFETRQPAPSETPTEAGAGDA